MGEFSSITRTGKHEPFGLHLARGYIQGHEHIHKFGYSTSIGTSDVLVWDGSETYTYPTTAVPLGVVGTSTTDASQITVQGLDGDYNFVSNIVTLDGTTTVTTSASFLRTFRAFVSDDNAPAGDVNIRHSGNLVAKIQEGENQTLMATYTVPAGHTAYLYEIVLGSATEQSNKYVRIRLRAKEDGGVSRTKAKYTLSGQNFEEIFDVPLVFNEKTDIEITAESSSNVQEVSALFDLVLIKNESV